MHRILKYRLLGPLQSGLSDLHSPYLLKGLQSACERILRAVQNSERIMVFGDYDVDGVVSSTILFQTLTKLGATVSVRLPNRFTDGYGLNMGFIEECKHLGVKLIITVDCGISNVEEVALAKRNGIDVVITDHHQPPAILPFADAIVNPNQADCTYPEKSLAGAGVTFKLCQALLEYSKLPSDEIFEFLDLVALATTADCMPITGENRILVKYGLEKLKKNPSPGLKALIDACNVKLDNASTYTFGFQLGPPINAAGRLDSALDAFWLLNGKSEFASKLNLMNTERQGLVKFALEEAEKMIEPVTDENKILIVGSDAWGIGVIGLIAGKLTEKYNRPSIAMTKRGDEYVGSARSISDYSIVEALGRCKQYLGHFGGHIQAAGFSLKPEHLEAFTEAMKEDAVKHLSKHDFTPILNIDTQLDPGEVSMESVEQMSVLEPFGMGNPTPLFILESVNILNLKKMGADGKHLSMNLQCGSEIIRGVAFGCAEHFETLQKQPKRDIACQLTIDEWNGQRRLNLVVKDMK